MVSWLEADERPTMTDVDFLATVLRDGKPHTTNEILHASFKERGCGMTVHSRAADLRKRGLNVICTPVGKVAGRNLFEYQLASSAESPLSNVRNDKETHGDVGRGGSAQDAEQLRLVAP